MNKAEKLFRYLVLALVPAAVITAATPIFMTYVNETASYPAVFALAYAASLAGFALKRALNLVLPRQKKIAVMFLRIFVFAAAAAAIAALFSLLPDSVFDLFRTEKVEFYNVQRGDFNFDVIAVVFFGILAGLSMGRRGAPEFFSDLRTLTVAGTSVAMLYFIKGLARAFSWGDATEVPYLVYSVLLLVITAAYAVLSVRTNVALTHERVREFSNVSEGTLFLRAVGTLVSAVPFFVIAYFAVRAAVYGIAFAIKYNALDLGEEAFSPFSPGIFAKIDTALVIVAAVSAVFLIVRRVRFLFLFGKKGPKTFKK